MTLDHEHARPPGVSDETVAAVGKLSEAFEAVEEARGHLISFHRTIGGADLTLEEAIKQLRLAGHADVASDLEFDLLGRNVIHGRWTFQLLEEFNDGYHAVFKKHDQRVRDALMGGRHHVHEAEMKQERRTHGRAGHEAVPREPDTENP